MKTKEKINQVNEDFYNTIAKSFSQTRQYAWEGWKNLLEKVNLDLKKDNQSESRSLQEGNLEHNIDVLDLGCGNGRFAHFLAENLNSKINYLGVDSCAELLDFGEKELKEKNYQNLEFEFKKVNILDMENEEALIKNNKNFDLITLFGVMHHIYDEKDRDDLFNFVEKNLKNDGYFIFATWQFADNKRQMNKNLELESLEGQDFLQKYDLEKKDFGENDYILNWTRINQSYRYCRNYPEKEVENLCKKNNLKIQSSFLADGKEGDVNKYFICVKN